MMQFKSRVDDLLRIIDENPNYDSEIIRSALNYATKCHEGQCRRSGEPYIEHPINVALILTELGMDTESITAALLHDVVEDTEATTESVQKMFGKDVALLVDGVTKLGKIPYYSREEQQAENLRKMLFAMAEDVRVIIIKLADRLHNMRTIDSLREQKRRDISLETIEVYAPIAHRLGIRGVKEELEDLCIRQLDPMGYAEILSALSLREKDRKEFLSSKQDKITEKLSVTVHGKFHIEGRVKSIHGIYRKMYMQGRSFDEIYDIYAVRVIVDTVNECYNVLGVIHDMFRPIPGRFKDYISTPKQNQYQSLHTTVIDREGIPFEVQIRTWDMHHTAEFGIAAHWKYKVGAGKSRGNMDEHLAWIRQLLDAQRDSGEADELVTSIKNDLTLDEVFVVTPKGDVTSLPAGSTVIDFAYAIHTAVGNRMIGAKVDGRIVPIDYVVKNGEIIEIITTNQTGKGPARDWLNIAKTSEARTKIRSWFKKEKRDENIAEGKMLLEREIRSNIIGLNDADRQEIYEHFAKAYHSNSLDDFFAAVGYGGILMSRLMPRIREYYAVHLKNTGRAVNKPIITPQKQSKRAYEGVIIEGIDNCLVRFSSCCGPLPGDDIIGFVTRGHGVSIHKRDCTNVPTDIMKCEHPDRWIAARWAENATVGKSFKATLYITGLDRPSIIADISLALTGMRVPMHAINAKALKDGNCQIYLTISAEGTEHLESIIARLLKISDVITVDRTGGQVVL